METKESISVVFMSGVGPIPPAHPLPQEHSISHEATELAHTIGSLATQLSAINLHTVSDPEFLQQTADKILAAHARAKGG